MKITKDQALQLLTSLGMADVQLVETKEEADELNPESILDAFLEGKKPVLMQKFESDILPEKLKEAAGKFGGNLKNYIRKASDNVIKTSDLEGKTDEEAINLLKAHLHQSKDQSTEEIRKQMEELIETHKADTDKIKGEYDGKISEQTRKFESININSALSDIIKGIPLLGEDEKMKVDTLAYALNNKFTPKWNEEKKFVELREKENPDKLALNGNNLVDVKQFATEYFTGLGMIKKDTSGEEARNHLPGGNNGPGKGTDFTQPGAGLPFGGLMESLDK